MTDQQRTLVEPTAYPRVAGRCPSCGSNASLFLGDGGYVTCSNAYGICGDPGLASERLGHPEVIDQLWRVAMTADDVVGLRWMQRRTALRRLEERVVELWRLDTEASR